MDDEGVVGFILGVFLTGIFMSGILWINESDLERQAINRGYATYCSTNGEWAWKGECKE